MGPRSDHFKIYHEDSLEDVFEDLEDGLTDVILPHRTASLGEPKRIKFRELLILFIARVLAKLGWPKPLRRVIGGFRRADYNGDIPTLPHEVEEQLKAFKVTLITMVLSSLAGALNAVVHGSML